MSEQAIPDERVSIANAIATGKEQIPPTAAPIRARGAANDYNAKGRGSTIARRVLRNGAWEWVSAPASRGRYLASDRKDTQYGNVWIGEVLATYTLGGRGKPEPDNFLLVLGSDDPMFHKLPHTLRRDGQYSLTLPGNDEPLLVTDPAWR